MIKKYMVCIICPLGCKLEVMEDKSAKGEYRISGANCQRGRAYGLKELTNPTRILTSTVKIKGAELARLPVRTRNEIPKDKIFEAMKVINSIEIRAPVSMGDLILENILGTGIDIIASRNLS